MTSPTIEWLTRKWSDPITKFFEDIGYSTSWDFDKKNREQWYEIYKNDRLILQISKTVPSIDVLVQDMIRWNNGLDSAEGPDYWIAKGPDTISEYNDLVRSAAKAIGKESELKKIKSPR